MDSDLSRVPAPKVRVLVADNEEVIARTLAQVLALAGYEVCAVYGGEAALRLLDLFRPDFVITDVTMSGVTGIEVAYAAKLMLPRCRILLFTGSTDLHQFLRSDEAEALPFDFLCKPIEPADILAKVRSSICSNEPPLVIPIEWDDSQVH